MSATAPPVWSEEEVSMRQALEQRLRQAPGNRGTMVALAGLLAGKQETAEAVDLLQRAAQGITNDPDAGTLLRKIAVSKLELWGGLRAFEPGSIYVNCTEERKKHVSEAMEFFDQAMSYPENTDDPAVMIEGANAKLAAKDITGALKDYSFVVANFPNYPKLTAAICRAASLLAYLGDRQQAAQYLAYAIEDPPEAIGFAELELRALLTNCLVETHQANGEKGTRLYAALAGALVRAPGLPEGFDASPPPGEAFKTWPAPWRLVADRMLARCDYVTAAEFLRILIKRQKNPENYTLLGECRYMLGDKEAAIEAMAKAHGLDSTCVQANARLLEWDFETWAPVLDKAAAAALIAKRKAEEEALRRDRADKSAFYLELHVKRNMYRRVLGAWCVAYEHSYAATQIGRIARGRKARMLAADTAAEAKVLAANRKRVVGAINRHLLRHVFVSWQKEFRTAKKARLAVAFPLRRRWEHRVLNLFLATWRARARQQVIGRESAKFAMRGPKEWGTKESGLKAPSDLFYSPELGTLSSFPLVRKQHEMHVAECIVEAKRISELVKKAEEEAAQLLPAIDDASGPTSPEGKKKKRKKKKAKSRPCSPEGLAK